MRVFTDWFLLAMGRWTGAALLLGLLALALPSQGQVASVSTILNPDGTLRAGSQGSFDATGYQLSYGKGGQPVLRTAASGWEGLSSDQAATQNSLSNYVFALAVSGNTVYVGGVF